MLISLDGKEICAYRKVCAYKRAVYDTALLFGLPVGYHDVTATDPPWRLSVSFEDTVSRKEIGNRGFEKYWRFRRVDSRTLNWSATITAQMNVRSSVMALSPLMPLEASVDNNRQ